MIGHILTNDYDTNLIQIVAWNQEPYIHNDANGGYDGILGFGLRQIFAEETCPKFNVNITIVATNQDLYDIITANNVTSELTKRLGIGNGNIMFGPISPGWRIEEVHKQKQLFTFNNDLMHYDGHVLVQRMSDLALTKRIADAFSETQPFISTLLFLIVFISALMWAVEKCHQVSAKANVETFGASFGRNIWWAVVTLSTVGYGDIVPTSFLGRLMAIIWMFTSMLFTSFLTSSITNGIMSHETNFNGKVVGAVTDTWEEIMALQLSYGNIDVNQRSLVSLHGTYASLLDNLASNTSIYAGIMESNVAARMNTLIEEKGLRLTRFFERPTSLSLALYHPTKTRVTSEILDCLKQIPIANWRRTNQFNVPPLIINASPQLPMNWDYAIVVTGLCVGAILLGVASEALQRWVRHRAVDRVEGGKQPGNV